MTRSRCRACAALLTGAAIAGCDAASSTGVANESIVALPSNVNLLRNPGFVRQRDKTWYVHLPAGVSASLIGPGRRTLTISAGKPGSAGAIFMVQATRFLPDARAGAVYLLRVRLRASGLTRPVKTELRLDYAGGAYGFFTATPARPVAAGAAISGTTAGWITMQVRARAALPLTAVQAFLVDSLAQPVFSGSISIADPQLYALERAGL